MVWTQESYHKSVQYHRPGDPGGGSPGKECLWWQWVTFPLDSLAKRTSSSESSLTGWSLQQIGVVKNNMLLPTGVWFGLASIADRTNVATRDLHGLSSGFFVVLCEFLAKLVSKIEEACAIGLQTNKRGKMFIILSIERRLRIWAESVLGRNLELISWRVDWREIATPSFVHVFLLYKIV